LASEVLEYSELQLTISSCPIRASTSFCYVRAEEGRRFQHVLFASSLFNNDLPRENFGRRIAGKEKKEEAAGRQT
jgi:hypothetical protein